MAQLTHEFADLIGRRSESVMRNWVRQQEVLNRLQKYLESQPEEPHVPVVMTHPYITISRETGAGGKEVAKHLSSRLAWPVIGKDVLNSMAREHDISRNWLEVVDERAPSWFYETMLRWWEPHMVSQSQYITWLKETLLEQLARESHIIIGRGARFLLPRELGTSIRLIAPLAYRIDQISQQFGCSNGQAREYIQATDHDRDGFIRYGFSKDPNDIEGFDLVINMSHTTPEGAAEVIERLYRNRTKQV